MIPVMCRVKHDPDASMYGDCVRACVASIMELDAEKMPHFFDDNCSGEVGNQRIRAWLKMMGYAPFWASYDGSATLAEFLEVMGEQNSNCHYILYGSTGHGEHVVVCRGGAVVHNPAWYGSSLVGPGASGYWHVLVIARA